MPPRFNKVISGLNTALFVASNAAFLFLWLSLCVRVFRHWNDMGERLQADAGFLVIMFAMLWLHLLWSKSSVWCFLTTAFVLSAVLDIVPHAF
jgi:hypothetical protein